MKKNEEKCTNTLDIDFVDLVEESDPILRQVCEKVEVFDENLQKQVDQMSLTLHAEGGLGIAANQVGFTNRVFVRVDEKDYLSYVNPSYEILTDETQVNMEGCLSSPDLWIRIKRPLTIRVVAQNLDGAWFEEIQSGPIAACLLHEIDHLDGIRFYDRAPTLKRKQLREKAFKQGAYGASSLLGESLKLFPESVRYDAPENLAGKADAEQPENIV